MAPWPEYTLAPRTTVKSGVHVKDVLRHLILSLYSVAVFNQTIAVKATCQGFQMLRPYTAFCHNQTDLISWIIGAQVYCPLRLQDGINLVGSGQNQSIFLLTNGSQSSRIRYTGIKTGVQSGHTQPFA